MSSNAFLRRCIQPTDPCTIKQHTHVLAEEERGVVGADDGRQLLPLGSGEQILVVCLRWLFSGDWFIGGRGRGGWDDAERANLGRCWLPGV